MKSDFIEEELEMYDDLKYENFVVWINSMYLTKKGYEYLAELKQRFKK